MATSNSHLVMVLSLVPLESKNRQPDGESPALGACAWVRAALLPPSHPNPAPWEDCCAKLAHGPLQRRRSLHPLACHRDADLPRGSRATLAGPGPSLFFAAFVGFGFGFGFGHTAWLVRSWFPIQRSNPGPWPWKCRVLTTEPQVVYPLFGVYLCCCPSPELQ